MVGTRLWPPASTRPSSAATSARTATASSIGFRRVVAERRRLHRLVSTLGLAYVFELMHGFWHSVKVRSSSSTRKVRHETPAFSYHDPRTTADVVGLLGSLDNAKLLAGGQSLMPMLNMRYVLPDHVIDLNRVDGLSYIRDSKDALEIGAIEIGAIEIGAMTRQRDIEFSDLVRRRCPLMHEAIVQVGHRQTRNRGTLGGSLCHLDPAAELVSVAAALDAKVTVTGKNGARSIDFAAFPVAYMTPALELDELLTGATFPVLVEAARLRLRRVFPPSRRFRHRFRGGADRGR